VAAAEVLIEISENDRARHRRRGGGFRPILKTPG
jgi:hypothetical protein